MKKLLFNKEARKGLFDGMDKVYKAVSSTLGPGGKNVLIEIKGTRPHITKDGATVAKHIELIDPIENQGAQLLKSVSTKTASEVGDGTTTATIIGNYLMRNGLKLVESGASSVAIERGMLAAYTKAKELVEAASQKITPEQILHIAKMSVNGADDMAKIVADAFETSDEETAVLIEDNWIPKDELEVVNGWQWVKGYISHHFVNQGSKMRVMFENPLVFITDQELTTPGVVLPILHLARGVDLKDLNRQIRPVSPVIIIAKDITGGALATLVENHVRGLVPVCAVRAPGYTKTMGDLLEDLAAYTGTKVLNMEALNNINQLKIEAFGKANKAIIESNKTTIVGGNQKELDDRLEKIRHLESQAATDWERKDFKERISKLKGRIASIKVGAASEIEIVERKDRYEDAVYAVKAAIKSGIVAGGGLVSYILSKNRTRNIFKKLTDEQKGENLFWESLGEPIRNLYENADRLPDIRSLPSYNNTDLADINGLEGFDLQNNEKKLVKLVEKGIVEPSDVLIIAMQQAVSLAGTVLKTAGVVAWMTDKEIKELHG